MKYLDQFVGAAILVGAALLIWSLRSIAIWVLIIAGE